MNTIQPHFQLKSGDSNIVTHNGEHSDSKAHATPEDGIPVSDASVPILYFDGVCGLCNRLVDFVLRHDRRRNIKLAPLQGETAQERLEVSDRENMNTVILQTSELTYRYSSAIVRLFWNMGHIWRILGGLLWIVPKPIRDIGYRIIAANRYRFFGKKETCRMPTPDEHDRLLP